MLTKSPMDEKLAAIVRPSVEALGFELVRVRLMGGESARLQIMAERPDGTMDVDACADLSRTLSAVLDVEDPIEREYTLEVSSPGVDRPLTRVKDFSRHQGFEAKLETRDLIDGRKRFKGVLRGVAGEGEGALIRLETQVDGASAEVTLPFEALSDAKLVLTDALIAESLKGRGGAPAASDGAEIDLEGLETQDAAAEDDAATEDDGAEGRDAPEEGGGR